MFIPLQWFSANNMSVLLKVACAEAEQTSDEVTVQFLSGDLQPKDFIRSFMEAKTVTIYILMCELNTGISIKHCKQLCVRI